MKVQNISGGKIRTASLAAQTAAEAQQWEVAMQIGSLAKLGWLSLVRFCHCVSAIRCHFGHFGQQPRFDYSKVVQLFQLSRRFRFFGFLLFILGHCLRSQVALVAFAATCGGPGTRWLGGGPSAVAWSMISMFANGCIRQSVILNRHIQNSRDAVYAMYAMYATYAMSTGAGTSDRADVYAKVMSTLERCSYWQREQQLFQDLSGSSEELVA